MALFENGVCRAAVEASPASPRGSLSPTSRPWESLLDDLLSAAGASLSDIDGVAIGLGPGSFSGIRTALAFAKGLSLPGNHPVLGFPSATAMAREFFHASPDASRVFLVGDARRDTFWLAEGVQDAMSVSISCLPAAEALQRIAASPDVPVLSPDFARLSGKIAGLRLFPMEGGRPLAQALGELASLSPDRATVPPVPLYLHPAVRP